MKKIKKIKIKLNGKSITLQSSTNLSKLVKNLKIPIKKVAIEVNQEIIDKKKLEKILLKKDDRIEIVHFIGGG